jgi:putative SOS response-associated peptidase YedK
MCGRFTNLMSYRKLVELYRVTEPEIGPGEPEPELKPRYNVAPSQLCPVVRLNAEGGRELAMLRWGLIPAWAEDPKIAYSTINARAETVHEKPAFRAAFRKRRCLVPADGFYEWKAMGEAKQPFRITMKGGEPFAMAGLWERWDKSGDAIESFTIIVTQGNAVLKPIHDRMPVILHPDTWDAWLASKDTAIPMALLQSYPAAGMTAYPVSKRVNSPRNDDPEVIEPLRAA